MYLFKSLFVSCALVLAGAAQAATIVADITGLPGVQTETLPPAAYADPGPATVFAGSAIQGSLSAPDGLFDTGVSLSTNLDSDPISASFAAPLAGLQFTAAITDEFGDYLDGTITLAVAGEMFDFVVDSGGPDDIGVTSDTGLSGATLSISAFDTNASAVAFLDLSTIRALTAPTGPMPVIPLPGSAALLLGGLAGLGALRRRVAAQTN